MNSDDLFQLGKRLSEEMVERLRNKSAQATPMTVRETLLDLLASNGSVVVCGCNDETWAAIDRLVETGLARGEAEERGLLLVVTLQGLKEAEGIRR